MNRTDADCKKRWKYIRDSYNRYKRKKKMATGSGAPAKNSKWELFERLRFLEQISTERASASNISSESLMSTEEAEIPFVSEENLDTSIQPAPEAAKSTHPPAKKRKKVEDDFLTYLKKRDDQRQIFLQEINTIKENDDEVNRFGNHIKSIMRKLNQRFQVQARSEIFNILTKYELMQMDMESSIQTAPPTSDEHIYASSIVSPSGSASAIK
ncbi:uncharacterized protein [Diabrotica undecimpunctata]|uniref:uncharacterized protein n=1 Tax=Diabrotica undecimpunctata TaxID=50387 RepID=UPI003B63B3DC